MDILKRVRDAEIYCKDNLLDLVKEMVAWQENGVRADGKFSILVAMLMPPFYEQNALSVAESMIKDAAYRKIIEDSDV